MLALTTFIVKDFSMLFLTNLQSRCCTYRKLHFAGTSGVKEFRVRNGFVPASRRQVFGRPRKPAIRECPFVNLPEARQTRWGEGLTADVMKKCVWVRSELVAQIEFLEWTESDHLRHSRFVGLREDKDARLVVKEQAEKRI